MNAINQISEIGFNKENQSGETDTDFNQRVLDYIRKNRPEGNLQSLFDALKKLYPGHNPGMGELTSALTFADSTLRLEADPDIHRYTHDTLDALTTQGLGVNSFYNSIMNDIFFPQEENELKPDLY